ncbi:MULTISPECIES: thioesterase family protein [unclassified Nocardioides]|uniref:thioesterase family protein n=1 Tax=unclassified Nocardioides TaxID=2615069 RepID=UPI00114FCF0E|nr:MULTISPECIES: thioesterase family protein [unclassified Nocardioides]TQK69158.1 acyl-CoA thioester hydrolase [Nocardioides sp. SLBN-35]WGY01536.1 thioesterase family protein [Nocardioides sp. QY071]
MSTQPTYDQLATLPAFAVQPVPSAFEDSNGFLNVRHYLGIGSEGLDESLYDIGIPFNWPVLSGFACLSAEHHLTYLHELRTGDQMSVRVRLLGRSERAAHALVFVLDDTNQRVACVFEEIFLCVEIADRRTAPWPADIAAGLDKRVAEHAGIEWEPVTSGCLELR